MNKLNLGASPGWKKKGWTSLDHKKGFRVHQAWKLPYQNSFFDIVFCSHMFEHIPHFKIEEVICEINRTMRSGGILRVLTPDLKKLAKAYVENDVEKMDLYIQEDMSGLSRELGLGQAFMGFIVSPGYDTLLFDSDLSEFISGYGHVYSYDFEMLSGLLEHYGFTHIVETDIDDSAICDHKDLRLGPYDVDKNHSLILECMKEKNVVYDKNKCLLFHGERVVYWMTRGIKVKPLTKRAIKVFSFIDKAITYVPLIMRRRIKQ